VIVIAATIGLVAFRNDRGTRQLANAPEATATQGETFGRAKTESATKSKPAADAAKAGGTASAGGAAMVPQNEATEMRAAPAPQLDLTLQVNTHVHGARFTLSACNETDQTIERDFGDAQRYDFEVSRDKKVVWRWSNGKAFAQMFGTERWKPDECKKYSADWNGTDNSGAPAGPGTYQATGILTSQPEQRTQPKDVCLDVC
jgi:hypothetical protein